MFLLKKIIAPLFFPLSIVLELLLVGLLLLRSKKRAALGKRFLIAGVVVLIVFSNAVVSGFLLGLVENRYSPLMTLPEVSYIVVLGGGHNYDSRLPVTAQLSPSSLSRLMEGIRLYRQRPGTKLVVSGGGVFTRSADAIVMAEVARVFGIPDHDIVMESKSRDTEEQSILLKSVIGEQKFALVTSASHMPRSMANFRKQKMNPIAAPADYHSSIGKKISPSHFYPSAGHLGRSERAFYEIIGLAQHHLKSLIGL